MALIEIHSDDIHPNPDNPRLIFREAEMNLLLDSISRVGIKVPLSVYEDGARYILIDGERRWRCAKKLNLHSIPALTQPKPDRLENILMMFNIHNVRLDWDLMPMALKLGEVRQMLTDQGQQSGVKELSAITGVSVPTVRRALELLELPQKYRLLLLKEAEKPKDQQVIKADLFVEINKSRNAIRRYVPEVFDAVSEDEYVEVMVEKYRNDVVDNVVKFRDVSRMARAERAGEDPTDVVPILIDLVRDSEMTISEAFEATVAPAYETRDLITRVGSLVEKLREFRSRRRLPRDLAERLLELRGEIARLLGD